MWLSGKACWMQHLLLDKSHFITEVPCPFHWTNETQRPSDLNRYSRIQSPAWCHYTRPQVHRWIRTIPDGFADHSDHQILRTKMDSVRVERTPADFQSAATTESAYCLFCQITPTIKNRTRKIAWLKVMVPLAGIAVCVPQPGGLDSNQ